MAEIEWLGDEVLAQVRRASAAGLNAAADVYANHAIRNVQAASFNPGGELIRKPKPSKPGEFPRSDTGQFRRSLTIARANPQAENPRAAFGVFNGLKNVSFATVGKGGLGYPTWLQTGTRRMAARPWATLTVRQASGQARAAFLAIASRSFASQLGGAA